MRQPALGSVVMHTCGPHQDTLLHILHAVVVLLQHSLGPSQVQVLIALPAPWDGSQPVQVVASDTTGTRNCDQMLLVRLSAGLHSHPGRGHIMNLGMISQDK